MITESPPVATGGLWGLTMTFAAALFWIIAGLTGASAVMVVVTQNIVRAAVWLLFTLVGVCGIYFPAARGRLRRGPCN